MNFLSPRSCTPLPNSGTNRCFGYSTDGIRRPRRVEYVFRLSLSLRIEEARSSWKQLAATMLGLLTQPSALQISMGLQDYKG
jgi:hypothetical protein